MRTQKIIKRAQKAGVLQFTVEESVRGVQNAVSHIENNDMGNLSESLSDLLFYSAALLQANGIDGEQLLYDRCEKLINEEKSKYQ